MLETKAVSKGFSRKRTLKSIHTDKQQVSLLCEYIGASLASVGCPSDAIKSYKRTIRRRLESEGNGFLKSFRGLFIQGVKTLGGDEPSFSGWSLKGKYPRLLNWVFKELERQRSIMDISMIRTLLSVLYCARSVKLSSSAKAEKAALDEFVSRVVHHDYNLMNEVELSDLVSKIIGFMPEIREADKFPYGARFNPSWRGMKSSSLWKGEEALIPELLARTAVVDGSYTGTMSKSFPYFRKKGPLGKVTLLPEKAGKYRVIVSYNGFVHATDLYQRCRAVLDAVKQDVSKDQSLGHTWAQLLSGKSASLAYRPPRDNEELRAREVTMVKKTLFGSRETVVKTIDPLNIKLVSADLSAFTDNMLPGAILGCLSSLRAANLFPLITEGTVMLPDGNLIKPRTALMGFKGCFEMSSILHHAFVQHYVGSAYRMCGDDIVGAFDVQLYESAVGKIGLKLNREKTVVSDDTVTFCGKVFFRGLDVSPYVPPLRTIVNNDTESVQAACRDILAKAFNQRPLVRTVLRRIVLKTLGRFKGYISKELPFKLGGFDVGTRSRSLLQIVAERRNHLIASNYVKFERLPVETRSRGTLPGVPFTGRKVLPWTNLYLEGGISLPRRPQKVSRRQRDLVGIGDILEFYYFGVGIPSQT